MRIAVVLAVYNRPDALESVLAGYLAQDAADFEVIIGDDGSTDDTRTLVESVARTAPFPIRHVWQEDRGFRAAGARNRGLAAAQADYLIFSDGDCIPPRRFVSRHRALAQRGYFLAGNRVLLSPVFTKRVLEEHLPIHTWRTADWTRAWLAGAINRPWPLLDLPDTALRRRDPGRWKGVKTCNVSAWRSDLLTIDGFDETYSGWGLEDTDLVIRLIHAGIRHKSARYAAPVYHLWHNETDKSGLDVNAQRLDELMASRRTTARLGVSQYL
jgi:glycosyltransferase involved in cell wall biosynthesis